MASSKFKVVVKAVVGLTFFGYCSIALLVFLYQDKLLYQPTEHYDHTYSVLAIQNESVLLEVIVLNPELSDAILYFGGSGEPVIWQAEAFLEIFPEKTIYLVNYRGYGGSSGAPNQLGLYSDALAIHDSISGSHRYIYAIGYSLGTGVATYLAANRKLQSLSLIAPYDSMTSLAQELYPIFPVSLMLRDKYDSLSLVDNIDEPTLVVAAENDSAIPYKLTRRLIDAFPKDQIIVKIVRDADHQDLSIEAYKTEQEQLMR